MEYMTYKEFEEEVNKMGYSVEMTELHVVIRGNDGDDNDNDYTIATISTKRTYVLDLYWWTHITMFQWDREKLANLFWRLTSTPMSYREEPKRYRYKVIPKYEHYFPSGDVYLNYLKINDNKLWISSINKSDYWQSEFTEDECEILESNNDLSLFEKVEVEDEQ